MKTLIFDGNNAVWRVANTLPDLRTPKGQSVQIVYGFLRLLRTALEKFEPDKVLACWDEGSPKYRLSIFPDYKGKRRHKREEQSEEDKKKRDAVFKQMQTLRSFLPLLGIRQTSMPDTEADDLIGIASSMESLGLRIVISGDKDMLQLVKKGVQVWSPNHQVLYSWKNFRKKLEMSPRQWLEHRVIAGDSSDCIPSAVKGIGELTASKLILEHGSIENLFERKVEKKVKKMGKRFARFYEAEALRKMEMNSKLMILPCVQKDFVKRATEEVEKEMAKDLHFSVSKVKREFLDRAFISLLADFGSWIAPFRELS